MKAEILGPALRNEIRLALDAELGDESGLGAFSDRVAQKVLAGLPAQPAPADVPAIVSATVAATVDALFPLRVVKG